MGFLSFGRRGITCILKTKILTLKLTGISQTFHKMALT
jgi:hypothetical protein